MSDITPVSGMAPLNGHDPVNIYKWLVALNQFVSLPAADRAESVEDSLARLRAYVQASMEDMPARIYTEKSFRVARRHFEFFPSYAALYKWAKTYHEEYPVFDPRYFAPNDPAEIAKLECPKTAGAEWEGWAAARNGHALPKPGKGDGT